MIRRLQKMQDVVLKDEVMQRKEDLQQGIVGKNRFPSDEQQWSSSLDQEEKGSLHIKEEEEEFPLTRVPAKNDDDEEEKPVGCVDPQMDKNRSDCCLDSQTECSVDSDFWKETRERQSGLKMMKHKEYCVSDMNCDPEEDGGLSFYGEDSMFEQSAYPGKGQTSCSVCLTRFVSGEHLEPHGDTNPSGCCTCDKVFTWYETLKQHQGVRQLYRSQAQKDFTGQPSTNSDPDSPPGLDPPDRTLDFSDSVKNRMRIHTDLQQVFVAKHKVPPGQQDWSFSLDQKNPVPLHLKEEQELPLTGVIVKKDGDEELHHSEDNREAEPQTSSLTEHFRTDTDGPDPDKDPPPRAHVRPDDLDSESAGAETDHSGVDCKETGHLYSGPKSLNKDSASRFNAGEKILSCSECKKRFGHKGHLRRHMRTHTGEKPFSCADCGKPFGQKANLKTHMRIHTGEKPYSCPFCGKSCTHKTNLTRHMTVHTGEKLFRCSACRKEFSRKEHFKNHKCVHVRNFVPH